MKQITSLFLLLLFIGSSTVFSQSTKTAKMAMQKKARMERLAVDLATSAEEVAAHRTIIQSDDPGDIVFNLDVEAICGDNQLLGVEFDGTYLWITGGGNAVDPNYLYKVDPNAGTLEGSWTQPAAATGWGIRDLAYDEGTGLIYGGNESTFFSFDPVAETWATVFSSSFGTIRGLAFDGTNFWTKSFGDPLYEFDIAGNVVNTYSPAVATACYGAAYDWNDGFLYLFSQDDAMFYQFDLSGNATGVTWDVSAAQPAGISGGAFFDFGNLVPGVATLGFLLQGTPDIVGAMELYPSDVYTNDVGISSILSPVSGYDLTAAETVTIKLKNFGTADQSGIPYEVTWDGPTGAQTASGTYAGPLAAGDFTEITLPTTADLSAFGEYTFTACTQLAGDEFTANDCKSKTVSNIAAPTMVYPMSADRWTGSTDGATITETSLVKGMDAEDGWFVFDVTSIPAGATITSVKFHGYVYETNYPYWSLTPLSLNPLTADPAALKAEIEANSGSDVAYSYNNEGSTFAAGWHDYLLGGTANADMTAALVQGWFAMGMDSRDNSATYFVNLEGWNETNVPYLEVEYTGGNPPSGDPPTNFTAAFVVDEGVETSWVDPPVGPEGTWVGYDDGINTGGLGLTGGGTFWGAIRWDAADLTPYNGKYMTQFKFFPILFATESEFTFMIWEGADAATLVYEQVLSDLTWDEWNTIALDEMHMIDASMDLSIGMKVVHVDGENPYGLDEGPAVAGYGDMISLDGVVWESMSEAYGIDNNYNLQAFVADEVDGVVGGKTPIAMSTISNPNTNLNVVKLEPTASPSHSMRGDFTGINIYRDNVLVNTPPVAPGAQAYTDEYFVGGTYTYTAKAVYTDGLSVATPGVEVTIPMSGDPEISVNPMSLTETHAVNNTQTEQTLTITNTGTEQLDWSIAVDLGRTGAQSNVEPIDPELYAQMLAERRAAEGFPISLANTSKPTPSPNQTDDEVIRYDDGVNNDAIGLTSGGTFEVSAYWPASTMGQYAGMKLSQVEVYINDLPSPFIIKIYDAGTATVPGALLHEETVEVTALSWNVIELSEQVDISGADIWIGYEVTHAASSYPAGCDIGPAVAGYGDMISLDGTTFEPMSGLGLDYNWNIASTLVPGGPQPTDDVGVQAILAPVTGVELGSEAVTFNIKNYGTASQSNIPWTVSWTGTGSGTLSGTYAGPLASGATAEVSAGNADLSTFGDYSFEACTNLAGDENNANDCKTKAVSNLEPSLCVDDLYSTGCSTGDGLVAWDFSDVNVPVIPCEGTPPWYHDYRDMVHSLEAGGTYTLTATAGYSNTYIDVWIDFNDDLLLTDDELILNDGSIATANTPVTFEITIPAAAAGGAHVLRYRTNWNSIVEDACETYSYGNACDFTAQVGGNPQADWLSVNIDNGSLGAGESTDITVTFDSQNLEDGTYVGALMVSSNDPATPMVDVPATLLVGAGGPEISVNPMSLTETHAVNNTQTEQLLTIANTGTEQLDWSIAVDLGRTGAQSNVEPIDPELYAQMLAERRAAEGLPISLANTSKPTPSPNQTDDEVIRYDDGVNSDAIGLTAGGTFQVAAYWPAASMGQYTGMKLSQVEVYINDLPSSFVLKVYDAGTPTVPGTLLHEETVAVTELSWNVIELSQQVDISGDDIWIGYEVTHEVDMFCAGCDAGPAVAGYGDMISLDGTTFEAMSGLGLNYNWNIASTLVPGGPQPTDDVGVQAILAPETGVELGSEAVTFSIKNYGTASQSNIPWTVTWTGAGSGTLSGTYAGPLASGATAEVSAGNADLSTFGDYSFEACTNLAGDENNANDCKTKAVSNLEPSLCVDDLYSSGCSLGDGLVAWDFSDVNVPDIPCSGTPPWYHDYRDMVHNLEAGETYTLTATAGYSSTYVDVWIDFNDDLLLTDDELILNDGSIATANTPVTFEITIPATAAGGAHVLRYRTNWNSIVEDACETYSYGNACDFTAQVGGSPQADWLSVNIDNGSLGAGESTDVTVTFDSQNLEDGTYVGALMVSSNDPATPMVDVPATLLVGAEGPAISVNPQQLDETHSNAPEQTTQILNINSIGSMPLTWDIVLDLGRTGAQSNVEPIDPEVYAQMLAERQAAEGQPNADIQYGITPGQQQTNGNHYSKYITSDATRAILYDNGGFVTAEGVGSNGTDYSELQDASLTMNTYGSGCQISEGISIADDFEVTGNWSINSFTFFAYQTNSGPPSTLNDVRVQVYDGDPSAGGTVIFGDLATNVMMSTEWTNAWRVLESAPSENRPIMNIVADVSGLVLAQGIYWVEMQIGGTGASGPWAPAVTIVGETTTGNSIQYTTTGWAPLLDVGPQGLPFLIEGIDGDPNANDIGVMAIVSPTTGVELGTEPVSFTMKNFGTEAQNNIPWEVSMTGPTGNETFTGTYSGTIASGETVEIAAGTANLSTFGDYSFEACAMLAGDEYPDNDCKTKAVSNLEPSLCVDDLYSSGCSYGDGLIAWDFADVNVADIPCAGTPPWYHDYRDMSHSLMAGETYTLTVQAGYTSTYFDVWIDFNDDLLLTDDELILNDALCSDANIDYTFDVTIPATAAGGAHVLRYRTNWTAIVEDACETYSFGNCCDFTAQVGGVPPTEWLSVDNINGTIEAGGSEPITVTFNSQGLAQGTYNGSITINSNAVNAPELEVPVTLTVGGTFGDPPTNLAYTVNGAAVNLTWWAPGGGPSGDFVEDFEGGSLPTGWLAIDNDNDGFNWINTIEQGFGFDAHAGDGAMTSASYDNTAGALTPDNWLITPAIQVTDASELIWWHDGQDPLWADEQYYVRVSTSGTDVGDFTETIWSGLTPAEWAEVSVSLAAYAGQTIYIAWNHTDVTDMFYMKIDDVTVTNTATKSLSSPIITPVANAGLPFRTSGLSALEIEEKLAAYNANLRSTMALTGYNVYRDGVKIATNITPTQYTDPAPGSGTFEYYVTAVYDGGESGPSNTVSVTMGTNTIIFEPFEDYDANDYLVQQAVNLGKEYWTTWSNTPGSAEDPMVSDAFAYEGDNSMLINGTNDAVLLINETGFTTGLYDLDFMVLIPTGFNGYFNVLQLFAGTASEWGMQAYFDANGAGLVDAGGAGAGVFTYTYDTWHNVHLMVDLDTDYAEMYFNDEMVVSWEWSGGSFGTGTLNELHAMNFYAWADNGTPGAHFDNIDITGGGDTTPVASWNPGEFEFALWPNQTEIQELEVSNVGTGTLSTNMSITYGAATAPSTTPVQYVNVINPDQLGLANTPTPTPSPNQTDDEVIRYDDGINADAIGLTSGGTFEVSAYWPSSSMGQYIGMKLSEVEIYINDFPTSAVLKIYGPGTPTNPGTLLHEQTINANPVSWNTIVLTEEVDITGGDIWIGYEVTHDVDMFCAGCDAGPAVAGFGDMISLDGNTFEPMSGLGLNYNWNIAAKLTGQASVEWLSISPLSADIQAGQSATFDVTASSNDFTGPVDETYYASIWMATNDPSNPMVEIPVELLFPVGLNEGDAGKAYIMMFPNPGRDVVNISTNYELNHVVVMNQVGQVVLEKVVSGKSVQLNTSTLQSGIYFVKINSEAGETIQKLIVQ